VIFTLQENLGSVPPSPLSICVPQYSLTVLKVNLFMLSAGIEQPYRSFLNRSYKIQAGSVVQAFEAAKVPFQVPV